MKLTYADIPLHDFGAIFIVEQSAQGEPEEAPQRNRHTLRVRVKTRQPTYADNADLIRRIEGYALSQQEATLLLQHDNGTIYLNQTARITGRSRPQNENERGTYLQSVEVTFVYYENISRTNNQCLPATYTRNAVGAPTLDLDAVESFKFSFDVRRVHELRSHRSGSTGRVEVRGKILGDPKATIASRRSSLLAKFDQIRSEIADGSDGTLTFGTFNQLVRVDAFVPELDQVGVTPHISYSMSASFSEFPNETGYAQCEFTVATQEDVKEGKMRKSLSGRIESQSEAAALVKLASVRSAFASGWEAVRLDKRSEQFSGEDGQTFLRLVFDEEYEQVTSNLSGWNLRITDSEEARTGRFRRTYSGYVEAKAATFDAAYSVATAKAKALGDNKHQFRTSGQIVCDDKQLSADRQVTDRELTDLIVRVEFSFEYELLGADRVYVEMAGDYTKQTFGLDTETVSGFIACASASTARALYDIIKAGYGEYLIRQERIREDRTKVKTASGVGIGQTLTPGNASTTVPVWGTAINTAEVDDDTAESTSSGIVNPPLLTGYARQFRVFEFSFEIHRPKAAGAVSMIYRLGVWQDFIGRVKVSNLSGQVFAATEAEADQYLDWFIEEHGLGQRITSRRDHEYVKKPGAQTDYQQAFLNRASTGVKKSTYHVLSFEESFRTRLTGAAAILQCGLEEEVECSGPRVVVKGTAQSTDVFQTCGTQSGTRRISGECVATDDTTAMVWCKEQQNLPLSASFNSSGDTQDEPPRISFVPEWEPLVTGIARGQTANVNLVRVRFSFVRHYENLTLL